MKTDAAKPSPWWQLLVVFAPLSLMSIGGGQSILGDLQREVVLKHHWLTQAQFLDDFAISRASAGPNTLIVTLVGWQVGGVLGAIATSLAIFVPSSLLFYGLARIWGSPALKHWQGRLARALAPISVGLSFGGAFAVLRADGADPLTWIVAFGAMLALLLTKVNPFVLLAGGAAAFVATGLIRL